MRDFIGTSQPNHQRRHGRHSGRVAEAAAERRLSACRQLAQSYTLLDAIESFGRINNVGVLSPVSQRRLKAHFSGI